jgi:hypothetical protein
MPKTQPIVLGPDHRCNICADGSYVGICCDWAKHDAEIRIGLGSNGFRRLVGA